MTEETNRPVRCLLVDDREQNLVALESLLGGEGVSLLKARSGPEALELLLQHEVALALIDVRMPEMDGFELAELMRGSERTRGVPIIFLTAGSADQQRRFRGYEAGAVDFLEKPIETEILKSKADVFFELFRQRQELARQRDELASMMEENSRLLMESQRNANALQDADRRKDEFLATLAHELRNPLAPLLNSVQVLRQMDVSPSEAEGIYEIIDRQTSHMVRLVDDLLEVSRITSGRIELQREIIDLADVVRNAVETSRPLLDRCRHEFTVSMPAVPLMVEGDMVRLTQVLANLLNNAAKYTPEGGHISLSVEREDAWTHIRIEDSGVGVPDEMIESVFEMFTQVNRQAKSSQGGLGIGLTLVKQLVELHDGMVDVKSKGQDQGSIFAVHLPAFEPVSDLTSEAGDNEAPVAAKRILAIDDDHDAVSSLKELLQVGGHEVATARSALEGVARAATFRPDIVILNTEMLATVGFEMVKRLRDLPAGKNVVLVALNGSVPNKVDLLKETGCDFHLAKPVSAADLHELLNSASLQRA